MNKKDTATSFLKLASSGKVKEAYENYVHPDFIHHNTAQGRREMEDCKGCKSTNS